MGLSYSTFDQCDTCEYQFFSNSPLFIITFTTGAAPGNTHYDLGLVATLARVEKETQGFSTRMGTYMHVLDDTISGLNT